MTTNLITACLVSWLATNAPVSIGTYHDKIQGMVFDHVASVVVSNSFIQIQDSGGAWVFGTNSVAIWTNPAVMVPIVTQRVPKHLNPPPPLPTIRLPIEIRVTGTNE